MGMLIEGDEAQNLTRELSELTGESVTAAVTEAIRERLGRLQNAQKPRLADRLLGLGKDCAARINEPYRSADHGEILYDELGLPRHKE
jgi:antitoxin VapB